MKNNGYIDLKHQLKNFDRNPAKSCLYLIKLQKKWIKTSSLLRRKCVIVQKDFYSYLQTSKF